MEKITLSKPLRIPGTDIILEAGDIITHGRLDEAFRHEAAKEVITKMCNVIGRRIGKEIKPSYPPAELNGQYIAYACFFKGDPTKHIVIKFKKNGNSDAIYSFGVTTKSDLLYSTDYEILLNGFNVVEVIDQVTDILAGNLNVYMEEGTSFLNLNKGTKFVPVKEKIGRIEQVGLWMQDNSSYIPLIVNNTFDYESHYNEFITYMKTKFNVPFNANAASLRFYCKAVLKANPKLGNGSKIPAVTVSNTPVTPATVTPIITPYDDMIDSVINMDAMEKWQTFEDFVKLVALGNRTAFICYGMPGTGKTHNASLELLKAGIPFDDGPDGNVMKGRFDDDESLMRFLFRNKDEQVVVFDDCDSLLSTRSKGRANLVKNLFDPKPVRNVGLNKIIKDRETDSQIPSVFPFKARIIALTNLPIEDLDSAVLSRTLALGLYFTVEEMLDMIRAKLDSIHGDDWDLPSEEKMEVYDFFKAILPRLKEINVRTFKFALQGRWIADYTGNSNWQRSCLKLLREYIK